MAKDVRRSGQEFSSWHVGVAAEAVAASLFARCGCSVSVQYGANQPEYDLIVEKDAQMLKVSVKGSKDGSWGLTQSFLRDANYQEAIEIWLDRHKAKTIFCFVQYKNVGLSELPRIWIATPMEIASCLRLAAKGRGDTILREKHTWTSRAVGAGTIEQIPDSWRFSAERVTLMLRADESGHV